MATRIGIVEAPKATLGEANVEQYIPVAEGDADDKVTPKNTTISDMAAFFAGDDPLFDPVVVDFRFDQRDIINYVIPASVPINGDGPTDTLNFREENKTVYIGEDDEIITNGPFFIPKQSGTYIVLAQFGALYTNQGSTGQWRWRFSWEFGGLAFQRVGEGSYIRPTSPVVNVQRLMFDLEILAPLLAGSSYSLETTIRNIGNSASSNPSSEAMVYTQGTGIIDNGISFVRVA